MTDYNIDLPRPIDRRNGEEKVHILNEKTALVSKKLESDKVLQRYFEYINQYKHPVQPLEPSTFAHYGKAEQYYTDSIYSILNYYPFDGSYEETLSWFVSSSHLDTSLLSQEWPTSVGHVHLNNSQYVSFYAGPQAITESEFIGKVRNNETGLKLDPSKGNTIEFWLKHAALSSGKFTVLSNFNKAGANNRKFKIKTINNTAGLIFTINSSVNKAETQNESGGATELTPQIGTKDISSALEFAQSLKLAIEDSVLGSELVVGAPVDEGGGAHSVSVTQLSSGALTTLSDPSNNFSDGNHGTIAELNNGSIGSSEIICDVGSYPDKLSADKSMNLKIHLASSGDRAFNLSLNSGSFGVSNLPIGTTEVNQAAVADSKWHHYAVSLKQNSGSAAASSGKFTVLSNFNKAGANNRKFKIRTFNNPDGLLFEIDSSVNKAETLNELNGATALAPKIGTKDITTAEEFAGALKLAIEDSLLSEDLTLGSPVDEGSGAFSLLVTQKTLGKIDTLSDPFRNFIDGFHGSVAEVSTGTILPYPLDIDFYRDGKYTNRTTRNLSVASSANFAVLSNFNKAGANGRTFKIVTNNNNTGLVFELSQAVNMAETENQLGGATAAAPLVGTKDATTPLLFAQALKLAIDDSTLGSELIVSAPSLDAESGSYIVTITQLSSGVITTITDPNNHFGDGFHGTITSVNSGGKILGSIDSFMAGTIGAGLSDKSSLLVGSVDSFRFWKGARNSREIQRFYDQKVYASEHSETDYESRLGLSFRFNQPIVGNAGIDSIILDHSGNDIVGKIINYTASTRFGTSAVDLSDVTTNTEIKDPILIEASQKVESLRKRLEKIGKSYDIQNFNTLEKTFPAWTRSSLYGFEDTKEFDLLLHLLATVFDSVKNNLDSLRLMTRPEYADSKTAIYDNTQTLQISSSLEEQINDSHQISNNQYTQNKIDFMDNLLENYGIKSSKYNLLWHAEIDEVVESIIDNIRLERSIYETRSLMYDCLAAAFSHVLNKKGSEASFNSVLNAVAAGRDIVSLNILGKNSKLFLNDDKVNLVSKKIKSINFADNREAVLHLSASSADVEQTEERSFVKGNTQETEYTFEGNFIFPKRKESFFNITLSSIFGLRHVKDVANTAIRNNNLTFASPSHVDYTVYVEKENKFSTNARFKVYSAGAFLAEMTTPYFNDIYDSTLWNLSLKVTKDQDNKFVPTDSPSYMLEFVGNNYISNESQHSFHLSKSLTNSEYNNFRNANKTTFIGASRTNITGSTVDESDIKVLDFNFWNTSLDSEELKIRAKTLKSFGTSRPYLFENTNRTGNKEVHESLYSRFQLGAITAIPADNNLKIQDEIAGSKERSESFGDMVGLGYNFTPFSFSNDLDNCLNVEVLTAVENTPISNIHGSDAVSVKESESEKYSFDSKSELKILSFEKSMYNSVSKDMISFLSGVKSFHNLIGDPINKYRKNYKLLSNINKKYFFNVKNENQFERYVNYYKWIDKAIGMFLENMIPASVPANTGFENVLESHALERNKIDYRLTNINSKEIELEAVAGNGNILAPWRAGEAEGEDAHANSAGGEILNLSK